MSAVRSEREARREGAGGGDHTIKRHEKIEGCEQSTKAIVRLRYYTTTCRHFVTIYARKVYPPLPLTARLLSLPIKKAFYRAV